MSENDGVEDVLHQQMQVAMTAAGRVAEALVRVREQQQKRAASESEARGRDLGARFDAQRDTARTTYGVVDDPAWWQNAPATEVAGVYQTAAAWKDNDPEAARVEQRIADEVRVRYDVDVRTTAPAELGDRLSTAADELARQADVDLLEGAALLVAADRADQLAAEAHDDEREATTPEEEQHAGQEAEQHEHEAADLEQRGEVAYDTAERRAATAEDLSRTVESSEGVEAKMLADVSQGAPAKQATHGKQGRAKARPTRGKGQAKQQQRGLSR
jgi:hypothetical protein